MQQAAAHGHSEHHHHHHHHVHAPSKMSAVFVVCIAINAAFVVAEAAIGFATGSLSLLSDAGHNLGDVFSLVLVLIGFRLAAVHASKRFTYGLRKSTVLISLLNAIILLVAVGAIVIEAVQKFITPAPIDGQAITLTALVGIVVNGATALMLMRGQKSDLNVRGAFLHMAADTLVSLGVVVSGLIISATGWYVVDPIVSLVIAVVILISTWRLLSESLALSLDGTPEGLDPEHIRREMEACDNVRGVHHLHIWAISTTANALTAHVEIADLAAFEQTKTALKARLSDLGIAHSTLEMETADCHCAEHSQQYGQ